MLIAQASIPLKPRGVAAELIQMFAVLGQGPFEKHQQLAGEGGGMAVASQLGQDLALPGDMALTLAHMPFNHFLFGFALHRNCLDS
jgi:hypothetical protein